MASHPYILYRFLCASSDAQEADSSKISCGKKKKSLRCDRDAPLSACKYVMRTLVSSKHCWYLWNCSLMRESVELLTISLDPSWLFLIMWITDPVWICSAGTNFLKKILTSQLSTGRLQARSDVTSPYPHGVKLAQKPKTYKLCHGSVWQM